MSFARLMKYGFGVLLVLLCLSSGIFYFGPISNPLVLLNAISGKGISTPQQNHLLKRLKIPDGFFLTIYARDLPQIRFMRFTDQGDLLVSRPRKGEVIVLGRDRNGDGESDDRRVLLDGLIRPHGMDIYEGWLYIAESNAVGRIRFDSTTGRVQGEYQKIITDLPDKGNHWTKTVRFGPDGMLYLSIGSSCNVCEEDDERRATIMRFKIDGSGGGIYASGLRNSVGLDWAPWNQKLYATDNGRDLLGDDYPPCELNEITSDKFYGWPYINGFGDQDPDYGDEDAERHKEVLKQSISPVHGFAAHNAPLGFTFLHKQPRPPGYEKAALVALHGSWNRSEPDGYKVVSLHWQSDGTIQERDFLSGFELDGDVIGRPVDVAEGSDGAIYISDDYAGAIYRVAYGQGQGVTPVRPIENDFGQISGVVNIGQLLSSEEISLLFEQGKILYRQYQCAGCHENGESSKIGVGKTLSDLNSRYTLEELTLFFSAPTPPMPNFGLDEQQRKSLAVYLLQSR